ncbi:MAG: hypothetical protein AAGA08_15150 [Pseudomonadota bacterium]
MEYKPRQPTKAVEDYTNAFLCMAALLVFMMLVALWAVFGYVMSLLTAAVFFKALRYLPRREDVAPRQ